MWLLLLSILPTALAFLDNTVVGVPKVLCEENDLSLDVVTEKPFRGNIFVKGRAKEPSCRQSYQSNSSNSYSLSLGKCGMQRLRSVNPRGINFVVTVIVSFHPSGFITKNDRAFHVKCFYMEPEAVVTSGLKVSALPTTELSETERLPTCEYSVRRDSVNGPQLTFANIGETVFHVWECSGADMGMLVKKCFVTDGEGGDHTVLDSIGCTTDSFLLSDLTYDRSLMKAHARSQVFKYADSNHLFFTCQIRLCQKHMGLCDDLTPPKCSKEGNRTRRSVSVERSGTRPTEIDVSTRELFVAGLDDPSHDRTPVCLPPLVVAFSPFILFSLFALFLSVIHVTKTSKSQKSTDFTFHTT